MAEEFTLAPMRRLLKKYGDLKIGEEASEEMRHVIGEYGSKIARASVENAQRENRKVLLARDVRAAQRQLESMEADH